MALLSIVHDSTAAIADAVVGLLAAPPPGSSARAIAALAARGRGLLAHCAGRLTVLAIGRRLGVDSTTTIAAGYGERRDRR